MSAKFEITDEQRRENLARAMAARTMRSRLKDRIKSGEASVFEVLSSDDDAVRRMRVRDLLRAIPGVADARSNRIMDEVGIASNRRVGGLGRLQRERLVEALRELGIE